MFCFYPMKLNMSNQELEERMQAFLKKQKNISTEMRERLVEDLDGVFNKKCDDFLKIKHTLTTNPAIQYQEITDDEFLKTVQAGLNTTHIQELLKNTKALDE